MNYQTGYGTTAAPKSNIKPKKRVAPTTPSTSRTRRVVPKSKK